MDTVYENIAETAFEKDLKLPAPYFTMALSKGKGVAKTPAWFPGCEGGALTVAQHIGTATAQAFYTIHLAAPAV